MKHLCFLLICLPIITFSQNTGIGEPNPLEAKLQVKAADSAVLLLQNSTSSGSNTKTTLYFKTAGIYSGGIATIGSATTHRMGLFTFGSQSPSNLAERLTITDGGNIGIGNIAPAYRLDVNGNTNINGTVTIKGGNPGAGKVLTSDVSGTASWQTTPSATMNQEYEKTAVSLSSSIQGSEVDFPGTNIQVPVAGTYLINYYLDAYNTFFLSCVNNCGTPIVYFTNAYLYNKTTASKYQSMKIDFSLQDHSSAGASSIVNYSCPEHQVSGSVVKKLSANDMVGFKMASTADEGVSGEIRIRSCTITLVRLY